MKIIISHDIDHLSVKEHIFRDLIIPKYIFWSFLELIKRKISLKNFCKKLFRLLKKGSWNNLENLLEFDNQEGITPTFFIATNNGKGLSYTQKQAKAAINLIKRYNFDIGVHGICYDNYEGIKKEFNDFKKISGLNNFGIRMHYLRMTENTLEYLSKVGYIFDSTIFSNDLKQEYKINGLAEMPFHLMDTYFLGPRQNLSLEEVKNKTSALLEKAEKENKKYVSILFHQSNFSEEFINYKNWYIWLIGYCKKRGYKFVNYRDLL